MNFSYWEHTSFLSNIDYAVVGSGIVGLNCALRLRETFPDAKVVVFEKGVLPSGASTKNAGFACFGSVSELLEDLHTHTEDEVIALVKDRVAGLDLLRTTIGDEVLDFKRYGGYELFTKTDEALYENCRSSIQHLNTLLKDTFSSKKEVFSLVNDPFSFKNIQKELIFNHFEGQIDTGKMMKALIRKCAENDIFILNSAEISAISSKSDHVSFVLNDSLELQTKKLFVATNGFAKQLLGSDVLPARAQVLITKPIPSLKIKGTFHLEKGYYYFRNIDNRLLFGGGRNLDFKGETTSKLEVTELIQNELDKLLRTTILPNTAFEIDTRWSGIMGVGKQKKPIIMEHKPNVYCGVRLGGMGIAIGSSVGVQLANLITD